MSINAHQKQTSTTMGSSGVVFTDVDETLITIKSMIDFLHFWMNAENKSALVDRRLRNLRRIAHRWGRAASNAAYYRLLRDVEVTLIDQYAEEWFSSHMNGGRLFNPTVLDQLHSHKTSGRTIVLVSGSFPPLLRPIAKTAMADDMICSDPTIANGRYTGDIDRAMIGPAKAAAVRDYLTRSDITPASSWAYGDHCSDLDLLRAVEHPTVVGDDSALLAVASTEGWPRIPLNAVPTTEKETNDDNE